MAWNFPKIKMGLLKWKILYLCFYLYHADQVTQQPQEWILNFRNFFEIFHFFPKFSFFGNFFSEIYVFFLNRHFLVKFTNRKRKMEGHFCRFLVYV